jgi:crossover junction endodeoxyribonuclease RuvC
LIVLGVDPGSLRTGYGAVETDGRRHHLIEMGALAPAKRLSLPEKLRHIHEGVSALIERLRPDALAVEDVFHSANTRTALVLGHVRGVVLLAGAERGMPVHEYPPATVKQQITGFGRAEKGQVAFMVTRLLALGTDAEPGDATDALAVALCFACQRTSVGSDSVTSHPWPPRTP